MFKIQKT